MTGFTPFHALAGGLLIGGAAALLLWGVGRPAGISGIAGGLLRARPSDWRWRVEFLLGLLLGGVLLRTFRPDLLGTPPGSLAVVGLGGLLVGFGAALSGGCTSGHGIVGLGRRSGRSLVAVLTFMFTGALVVALLRHGGGAS